MLRVDVFLDMTGVFSVSGGTAVFPQPAYPTGRWL